MIFMHLRLSIYSIKLSTVIHQQAKKMVLAMANLHFHMILALFDEFLFLLLLCILSNKRLPCYWTKLTKACLAIQDGSVNRAHV